MQFAAIDLLWLLLPLAAASGWLAARLDQKRHPGRTAKELPSAYFKGLNFLLNEQPDKAIEVFIQMLEVDSDTVETHLALGNLFRRRGEVERAIRIHQNLIARPTLDKHQRSLALLELGQDYLKAGLFDRAENLFLELAEIRLHTEQALRFLVHIYQQEKEWDQAIAVSRRLARASGRSQDEVIAQFYCELAEQAFAEGNPTLARRLVGEAFGADRNCVRASILLGRLEVDAGRHREALKAWKRIEEQDPVYLGEVASLIAASYQAVNDEAGLYDYFGGLLRRHGGIALMLALADVIRSREGVRAAEEFVTGWLRRQPSVQGLHRLLDLNLVAADASAQADLNLLQGVIGQLLEQQQGYLCQECGFRGKALHWQCPGCHRWNTVKPIPGQPQERALEKLHG
ncbi:MAG: lipopolysaccharide assembly protein LapB [Gammaproteobacteria bacterium]|nr:lipopolysaccharide assembly protein LapB [Gammaproteobacteria bacterium]